MMEFYNKYLDNKIKVDKISLFGIIASIVVIAGVTGFIYEYIFYFINSGMKTFYWRGNSFLPWVSIYAFGSLLLLIINYKYKRKPIKVFFISILITGFFEYISGFVIENIFHEKLWDYGQEIWNFGNISGYVCLRSILIFGFFSLVLIYLILPCVYYLCTNYKKLFLIISISLFSITIADKVYNSCIAKLFNLPTSYDIYQKRGIKYMNFK